MFKAKPQQTNGPSVLYRTSYILYFKINYNTIVFVIIIYFRSIFKKWLQNLLQWK